MVSMPFLSRHLGVSLLGSISLCSRFVRLLVYSSGHRGSMPAELIDQVKEIAVSVRPVRWQSLIAVVEMRSRRMKAPNRDFPEIDE